MNEKVKELVEAAKLLLCNVETKEQRARLRRAVEALEPSEIGKRLRALRAAVNTESALAWFNDMALSQNYSAINAALDAWFELNEGEKHEEE